MKIHLESVAALVIHFKLLHLILNLPSLSAQVPVTFIQWIIIQWQLLLVFQVKISFLAILFKISQSIPKSFLLKITFISKGRWKE